MLRIEQLKSLPEKLRLTPLARRKLGAIATAATLLSPIGAIPAKEISLQRYYSVAESTQPLDVNELLGREQQYPADSSAEDSLKVIDHETSSDVAIQFRYEDLEGLTFSHPSAEIIDTILDAKTLDELEDAAKLFMETRGLTLIIGGAVSHDERDNFDPVQEAQLESTKSAILAILNEITLMPHEVFALADVDEVIVAQNMRGDDQQPAGAIAWTNDGGTGSIGIDINNSRTFIGDSWNHELGHNLASSLEVLTDDNFDTVFESFNPTWFDYESQLEAKGGVTASYKDTATRAIYEWIVNRKYSTRSLEEDQADTFSLLWRGEGVPSANDQAHGTPLSAKRTAWIEQIDIFVPGFKRYAIGMWSEGKYHPKIVPADRGVFNVMLKDGYYSFK